MSQPQDELFNGKLYNTNIDFDWGDKLGSKLAGRL